MPTKIQPDQMPAKAGEIARRYPAVGAAYAELGKACANAGPLEGKTVRLIKLALAMGAASEGAVHSHVRRALEEGMTPDELCQVALLAIPTLGFPRAAAVLSWVDDLTGKSRG